MRELRQQVRQYADAPFPALVEGESGSGKEIVASLLHAQSSREACPFLALNCAALSPSLVEATLFGHARGAFTGAAQAHAGYFEEADAGTLFLDEIGELPLELQPKLLRVLENGSFQRVGETRARLSHARVIAATNRDLRDEVRAGRFRADLYHRLSVFTIRVPALRHLGEDRLAMLTHFARQHAAQTRTSAFSLDAEARARWLAYEFPGNVRELRNIVIRLATKYPGLAVSAGQLSAELAPPARAEGRSPSMIALDDPDHLAASAQTHLEQSRNFSLDVLLQHLEQGYIAAAMRMARGNVSQAARVLGINRTTLYSRMDAYQKDS
jgi:DNA-binding NtrC family response regulator